MFYAMEFIDGETVDALIKRQGPLSAALALQIADQVARALNAAQVHGLVHRDIKPANLMLVHEDDELTVKVIDFGLAKTLTPGEEDAATVSQGGFVGTPHFASPEQLEEGEIDVRSDIYSLGVTLWYMLAGQTPFAGSMAQVMSQHLGKAPPFERLFGLPPPVAVLLRRMLEKDREARPQTPSELRIEIEKCLAEVQGEAGGIALAAPLDPDDYATLLEAPGGRTSSTAFEVGSIIAGRYRLVAALGDTNTGVVFRAEDLQEQRSVRLLVLHRELTGEAATYTQIEREVERVAPVEHPNLLRVYGLETIETTSFIALEWTDGFSLLELLRARRELEAIEVLKLLGQAADGADFALTSGLNRLDLALHQVLLHFRSPIEKNTLLHHPVTGWPPFVVKINPLGITRELSASETWGGQQTMVGHPGAATTFVSEQTRVIQALGSLVYELLGGTLSPLGLHGQSASQYTPLANLSERGNEALREALAETPSYLTAAAFFQALSELDEISFESTAAISPASAAPASAPARMPVPPVPTIPEPEKRSRFPGALVGILGGAAALAAIFFLVVLPRLTPPDASDSGLDHTQTAEEPWVSPVIPEIPPQEPTAEELAARARKEAAMEASKVARELEMKKDWPGAIEAWVRIVDDYPESDRAIASLEALISDLRRRDVETNTQEFPALEPTLLRAAERGVVAAMLFVGKTVQLNDPVKARQLFEAAAERDDAEAMLLLGKLLLRSEPEAAFGWFAAAAIRNDMEAMTQMGLMLWHGIGCEKDLGRAIDSLRAAAERDHPAAKTWLGICYLKGINVPADPKRAVALFKEAVEAEDSRAMNELGVCFHTGVGVPRVNNAEAFALFTRSADLKHLPALGNLAVMFLNGDKPATENPAHALKLIEQGVAGEDDFCLYLYGRCHETGVGRLEPDAKKAREFYVRAAEAGNSRAAAWCLQNKVRFTPPADALPR